eukprot:TRINITY_DN7569_c0_g1_i1.p2 TRINITY_DN7569_c0_g1~~TRINITY_DN7569_c0_g1_i1.p2  ORF type:complete len:111 (+),score=24.23 TRINITY_DN7569_c0_g1_i1:472-804(+)
MTWQKKNGWKKCTICCCWVEKRTGCNHMTCRCKHEFCYTCGESFSASHSGNCPAGCKCWGTHYSTAHPLFRPHDLLSDISDEDEDEDEDKDKDESDDDDDDEDEEEDADW